MRSRAAYFFVLRETSNFPQRISFGNMSIITCNKKNYSEGKMRVIVLYYGDSEGRYASEALAESFRSFGSQCTTVDVSAFSSRIGQAIERTVSFAVSLMNLFRLRRRGASLGAAGLSGSGHRCIRHCICCSLSRSVRSIRCIFPSFCHEGASS